MSYKVLDIYRDLPRTNCGDCGKGSCFVFASAVYLDGFSLAVCPHLASEALESMEARLEAGRQQGEGRRPDSSEQAVQALREKISAARFPNLAERAGAEYEPGPPEDLRVEFLGVRHRITRDDVAAETGEPPSVWVKIFLLIYATRASGAAEVGRWAAFRDLPNTVSKARSMDECLDRLARAFEGRLPEFDAAAVSSGGAPVPGGSADRTYAFRALPRVPIQLLFWDRQEDFSARAVLLLDAGILDYLDQEAIVFLAEAFTRRLLGESVAGVTP